MTEPTPHPEELLAAAVDGELDDSGRAELEAHLATCDRCREEVRLARVARDELGTLPEVEVPAGILRPVERSIDERTPFPAGEPGRRTARRKRQRRDPTRVLAGLTIAAVLVILGGILLAPLLRGGSDVSTQEAAGVAAEPARAAAKPVTDADLARLPSPSVVAQDVDYNGTSIQAAAEAAAQDPVRYAQSASSRKLAPDEPVTGQSSDQNAASGGGGDAAATTAPSAPEAQPSASGKAGATAGDAFGPVSHAYESSVTDCVSQWTKGKSIVQKNLHPLRIVHATYLGDPATIAVYLQTAGGGSPGKVLIWVLSPDCRLVSFVQRGL